MMNICKQQCAAASSAVSSTSALLLAVHRLRGAAAPRHFAQSNFRIRCNANGSRGSSDSSSGDGGGQPGPSQPSPSDFRCFGQPQQQKMSTAEALRESLGGVSSAQGRVSRSTKIVLGTDDSEEKWRELDAQVNVYPGQRTFKAIGSGGGDFVAAMTACVEAVVGPVHSECVSSRPSSKGNYLAVTIDVWLETPDQALDIYQRMKSDGRLKFYI